MATGNDADLHAAQAGAARTHGARKLRLEYRAIHRVAGRGGRHHRLGAARKSRPPGHLFPTDHKYLYVNHPEFPSTIRQVGVVSPENITITQAHRTHYSASSTYDCAIQFQPCAKLVASFGHVTTITPALLSRIGAFDQQCDDVAAMLVWPHSRFHVHDAVWVPDGDTAFALRLARYCARNPVALERLTYEPHEPDAPVRYRSDMTDGPTAGTETVDLLEFLARIAAHIPDEHQVMTRYSGWYANRVRGRRRRAVAPDGTAVVVAPCERLPLREAQRRWAELFRRIHDVDPLACPRCASAMRVVAFITERAGLGDVRWRARRPRPAPPRVGCATYRD